MSLLWPQMSGATRMGLLMGGLNMLGNQTMSTGQGVSQGLLGYVQGKQGMQDYEAQQQDADLQRKIQERQLAEYDAKTKQQAAMRQMMMGTPGGHTMGGGINPNAMGDISQFGQAAPPAQPGLLDSLSPQEKQLGLLALESGDYEGLMGLLQKPEMMQTIDGAQIGRPGEIFQMDPATGALKRVAASPAQPASEPTEEVMGPNGPVLVPRNQSYGMTPYDAPNQPSTSEFERMIATLPPEEQQQAREAYIARQTAPPSGMSIEVGPDGTMRYVQGPGANMGTAATNTVEDKLIGLGEGIARLDAMGQQFNPANQQIWARLGAAGSSIQEKMGIPLSANDKAALEEMTLHKRAATDNLNQYIKETTGLAMTEAEAKRLMKVQPNAGEGIFDGDSPTEFMAKWDGQLQALRAAETRMLELRQKGFDRITPELARQYPLDNYMQQTPPAIGTPTQPATNQLSKTIGGKKYIQVNGQWFEQ